MALMTRQYGVVTRLIEVDPIQVGVRIGRQTNDHWRIVEALEAAGLERGSDDFQQGLDAARTAWRLSQPDADHILWAQQRDGSVRSADDYRNLA